MVCLIRDTWRAEANFQLHLGTHMTDTFPFSFPSKVSSVVTKGLMDHLISRPLIFYRKCIGFAAPPAALADLSRILLLLTHALALRSAEVTQNNKHGLCWGPNPDPNPTGQLVHQFNHLARSYPLLMTHPQGQRSISPTLWGPLDATFASARPNRWSPLRGASNKSSRIRRLSVSLMWR